MTEEESKLRETLKKILWALKSALLSLFNMDYQVESQTKVKVSKFKLVFILVTIATIVWIISFFSAFRVHFLVMGAVLLGAWLGFTVVAIDEILKRKKST